MSTPIFEQLRVGLLPGLADTISARLTEPTTGDLPSGPTLRVAGTLTSHGAPVTKVLVVNRRDVLVNLPIDAPAPGSSDASGQPEVDFALELDALDLDPTFDLRLRAVMADESRVLFAAVSGKRRAVLGGYKPRHQPLMVTSLGRTGTTWLMRLMAEHPGVVTYRQYPYEIRPAKYWLHLFRILSGVPDPGKVVGQPQEFHLETLAVGANPFRAPAFSALPPLEAWAGTDYRERVAAFALESIDQWYELAAEAQGEAGATYFAEKQFPDQFPRLVWSLYPGAKEVILVRDFRDMVSSMLAYNRKRGYDDFSRRGHDSDETWVEKLVPGVNELARAWKRRGDRAHLIRYEDLIANPTAILSKLFAYLDLDHSPATIAQVITKASADPSELSRHQTTRDPAASIGRWRQDLSPELQAATNEAFQFALDTFGYDPA
jgi:hypothetical protein